MNIYTPVLDDIHIPPIVKTFTTGKAAKKEARKIGSTYSIFVELNFARHYFNALLNDKGSRVYIKETELIGGDHEGN